METNWIGKVKKRKKKEVREEENGWTLIDAGLNNASTRELWAEQLRGKEVTDLFITHYHPDHFGYAGGLQQKTKARVSMTKTDAETGFISLDRCIYTKPLSKLSNCRNSNRNSQSNGQQHCRVSATGHTSTDHKSLFLRKRKSVNRSL